VEILPLSSAAASEGTAYLLPGFLTVGFSLLRKDYSWTPTISSDIFSGQNDASACPNRQLLSFVATLLSGFFFLYGSFSMNLLLVSHNFQKNGVAPTELGIRLLTLMCRACESKWY